MGELSAVTWPILGAWQIIQKDVDLQVCICVQCFEVEFIQKFKTKTF